MAETNFLTVSLTNKDIERIFSRITIDPDDPLGKCWIWTGANIKKGYGRVRYAKGKELIHRLIYAWLVEPIPRGRYGNVPTLDHICNNPPCCNPFHLHLVSNRENCLRGNSPWARNARKTHCPKGHLLPAEPNHPNGVSRFCKICAAELQRSEARKAHMRQYHWDHRDVALERNRQYYRNHKHQRPP